MRDFRSYLLIGLKGMGMGAADVIPGVSGGTIAFLTGIYQELIESIKSINGKSLKLLFSGKIKEFWKAINANFLISIATGIFISFLSLSKLMVYLMDNHPVALWSFFFGLIVASAIHILKEVRFSISNTIALLAGIACGVAICLLSPAKTPDSLWFIFLCGSIAICAMILPGISGSFILLLLGKYEYMLDALGNLHIPVIIVFMVGALIGLVLFSRLLSWLMKHYYQIAISVLSGIMIGSLVKVWPWQRLFESGISWPTLPFSDGVAVSGHIPDAVIFAALGCMLVFILELLAKRTTKKNNFSHK